MPASTKGKCEHLKSSQPRMVMFFDEGLSAYEISYFDCCVDSSLAVSHGSPSSIQLFNKATSSLLSAAYLLRLDNGGISRSSTWSVTIRMILLAALLPGMSATSPDCPP